MKIDFFAAASPASIRPTETNKVEKVATQEVRPAVQGTSKEDKATLSFGSDAVQSLVQAALETAPSRAAKVAALKQAVANSQYQLNAAKIAEAVFNADI